MDNSVWRAEFALGIPLFDEAHQVFGEQVQQLLDGPDQDFFTGLEELITALEDDFRLEEALMEAIAYPAICSHREQHARVLASLHSLSPDDVAAGRHAARLLLPWFELHLATADTALAIALQMAGDDTAGLTETKTLTMEK